MTKSNVKSFENDKNKNIIKTLSVFLCYFLYTTVVSGVLSAIGVTDMTVISFFADIIFFVGIVYAYRDNLKNDLLDLKNNYKFSKILKTVLFWLVMIFILNIIMGVLTDLFVPNNSYDGNTQAVRTLFETSPMYALFKTMFFGIVVEELLFRKSVSSLINNNIIFIIISSLLYTVVNLIYNFDNSRIILDFFTFFLPAVILSYAYIKNNRNIFIVMLIKFAYNIIPFLALIAGI